MQEGGEHGNQKGPFACKLWESLWRTQSSWVPLNTIPPNVICPDQFPSQSHSMSNLSVFWLPTEIKPSISNDPTNTFHFLLQKSHKIPMQHDSTDLLEHLLSSSLIFSASPRHTRNCTVMISVPGRVKPVKGHFICLCRDSSSLSHCHPHPRIPEVSVLFTSDFYALRPKLIPPNSRQLIKVSSLGTQWK